MQLSLEQVNTDLANLRTKWFEDTRTKVVSPYVAFYSPTVIPWGEITCEYWGKIYCTECAQSLIFCKHRPNQGKTREEWMTYYANNRNMETITTEEVTKQRRRPRGTFKKEVPSEVRSIILERYAQGNTPQVMAEEYQIAPTAIYNWLKANNVLRPKGRRKGFKLKENLVPA